MSNLVKHVAIIMDGNRRWAKLHNCSYEESYKKSVTTVQNLVEATLEAKIPYLTLFAFSTDNNKRSTKEISLLKELMNTYIDQEANKLSEKNIKFNVIGDYYQFDNNLATKLNKLKQNQVNDTKLTITIALNYSGKNDIIQAVNKAIENPERNFKSNPLQQNEIEEFLLTSQLPDPDILIRTGGYKRLSNFFLWQISYTELFFLDILWPDFNKEHFLNIIKEFHFIERKYGK
ncbi:UNVERIFIED_CONTAM: hypothetical protein PYX00_011181 [Menopon gallinae]|uniref:Alkyl transferase n=1 Tax=Menopon gallinae TaxID=328185 RepID=A0AAW2H6F5_9NEOP